MRYRASVSGVTGGMGVPRGPSLSWAPPARGPRQEEGAAQEFRVEKMSRKVTGEEALGTRAGPGCPLRVSEGTETPNPEGQGREIWPDLWVTSGLHGVGVEPTLNPQGAVGLVSGWSRLGGDGEPLGICTHTTNLLFSDFSHSRCQSLAPGSPEKSGVWGAVLCGEWGLC